jgi:hypothetical protein
VDCRVAGLTEVAQEHLTWYYLNRVWLKGIQLLAWGRRQAAVSRCPREEGFSPLEM